MPGSRVRIPPQALQRVSGSDGARAVPVGQGIDDRPLASPIRLPEQALGTFDGMLRRLAERGVVGLPAVQLCSLITQGVFMLALACHRDPDDPRAPDSRLRAQWTAPRDVPGERYPYVRRAARPVADDDTESETLLLHGVRLCTTAMTPMADGHGTVRG